MVPLARQELGLVSEGLWHLVLLSRTACHKGSGGLSLVCLGQTHSLMTLDLRIAKAIRKTS